MDHLRRHDILDFDALPDEDLPNYNDHEPEATAPEYHSGHYETPLLTYHLRQANRRIRIFVPYGPSASSSYKVISNTFRFFSKKKAEMEVIHVSQVEMTEKSIASIYFDNNGPLPWRPRAHVVHVNSQGKNVYAMEARNFNDWSIVIDGIIYEWALEVKPLALILREQGANMVIARFTYSRYGTIATNGAEVGELTVYRDGLSSDRKGIEVIICGLMVSIVHFKRMGRHYHNDEPIPAEPLRRAHVPSHRSSVASSSNA